MSKLYIEGRVTPAAATADQASIAVQGFRDGSVSTVDFVQRLAAAGRLFTSNFGTVATQLTFLAQAANRPDFWVRVPSGTTIMPVSLDIALGAMAGTVTTIDIRTAQNDIGSGTSSAGSIAAVSSRTDAPVASVTTSRQLATGDTTAETAPVSVYKRVWIRADDAGSEFKGVHLDRAALKFPFLVGPATWEGFIWATTTQATGYVTMAWIETPSTWWV